VTQGALFADDASLDGPGLSASLERCWLPAGDADRAFAEVSAEVPWEQHHIVMFGKRSAVPRLDVWMGDPGAIYSYSGIDMALHPWTPAVDSLRDRVSEAVGVRFNSALLNRYRDGCDSVGWHADDEPELGPEPVIAALSLGATRTFRLKRRDDAAVRQSCSLQHGDLLVMSGRTQAEWLHYVPRTAKVVDERISLTFRVVLPERP